MTEQSQTPKKLKESIKLPEGITATYAKGVLTIAKGGTSVSKKLVNPRVTMVVENNMITFTGKTIKRNSKKVLYTFMAHVNNMIKGVTEGFTYRLKLCSGHFPITIKLDKNKFIVSNFLGEKVPRTTEIPSDVTVKIDKEIITVTSSSKESAGQTAANIERATFIRGRDRRLFQDGIYIIEKPHTLYT